MITNKSAVFLSVIFILSIFFSACSSRVVPIINYDNISLVTQSDKALSLDDVNKALATAAVTKRWKLSNVRPGHATAMLDVRGKHSIAVDIAYTEKALSVKYKDSTNMLYKKNRGGQETIHSNYNRWVNSFLSEINKQILVVK